MPGRTDISKILVLGAGPIQIGQACEFDYSGTQACKALRQQGYEVVLVNSNPATIMTDPEVATRTYIEPLTAGIVEQVIARERPQCLLPTMGGQTALNLAVELSRKGTLERFGVELVGARLASIRLAEDREQFRAKMLEIGLPVPPSVTVRKAADVAAALDEVGVPAVVRPAFTLGGTGSGIARTVEELRQSCARGLAASPVAAVLVERDLSGWKEIELEVVRDCRDNFIVVCAIENVDPMGVHTGDSITVAPLQSLSDREYQRLRDAARKVMTAVGIDCGGSNIQFAVDPASGKFVVIEMNPRVSRSSALASKATGYPIARVAALLAVGLSLDEIENDVAGGISACFEPALDYVVTKVPRFHFEKFPGAAVHLGTEMKSVGEVMALAPTFQQSLQKALRGLELGVSGFAPVPARSCADPAAALERLRSPSRHRLTDICDAFAAGHGVEAVAAATAIDRWFLEQLSQLWSMAGEFGERLLSISRTGGGGGRSLPPPRLLRQMKRAGFSDSQIASLASTCGAGEPVSEEDIYRVRRDHDIMPVYRRVDTCAGEFPSRASYFYSAYGEAESELSPLAAPKVAIVGSGPNRIGQGLEFDYCCVQASIAAAEAGVRSVMINSNPETVSTDYDVCDALYFEPVTLEDVSNVLAAEEPCGVILQFGGQTPLDLAAGLEARGFRVLGTAVRSLTLAGDRELFRELVSGLGLMQPPAVTVSSLDAALAAARAGGYPLLVRPSFVLGGRSMQVVRHEAELRELLEPLLRSRPGVSVLLDSYLEDAVEVDVDAVSDGRDTVIAGVMEHIEEAGVHSGDSTCVLPPRSLPAATLAEIEEATRALAASLGVVGLLNVQYAVKDGRVYVLEANPRASRTVPFVSKATGVPWARIATRVILGERLDSLMRSYQPGSGAVAVKAPVIPFSRFPGSTVGIGPEMRSTGEVMGVSAGFAAAFARAAEAAGRPLPQAGTVAVSASAACAGQARQAAAAFAGLGFRLLLQRRLGCHDGAALPARSCRLLAGSELAAAVAAGEADLILSFTGVDEVDEEQQRLRRAALACGAPLVLTAREGAACVEAIAGMRSGQGGVTALQDLVPQPRAVPASAGGGGPAAVAPAAALPAPQVRGGAHAGI